MKKTMLCFLGILCLSGLLQAQSEQETTDLHKDLSVFETPMAVSLRKKVKKKDIERIQNQDLRETALAMLQHRYDTHYRLATYHAWLSPTTLGENLVIGDGYSKYEGVTGIYLPTGMHIILIDGIAKDKNIRLLVPDWNRHAAEGVRPNKDPAGWGIKRQEYALHNGANIIDVKDHDGLAYIDYYSDEPEQEQPVQVHFVNGRVNGYFDSRTQTDADWDRLLDSAVYPVIDAKGRHIQIAYPVADCKRYARGKGLELLANYDSLLSIQYQLMGLAKYGAVPDNHLLARVNYNYYMFRDGDGVAYMGTEPANAMPKVVDPVRVTKGDACWGFSHEVGHVHQLRPLFNWGGLGEVSNNVFSMYAITTLGNKSRLSEGKNYQKARDSIIALGKCYLFDKDLFNRLVPFWQLQLYFRGIGQYPDFYPDLFEAFRKQAVAGQGNRGNGWGDRGTNPAQFQLNFVKTACEVSKVDLTAFFEKYGFFHVGQVAYNDYGNYQYDMTQELVDECKHAIHSLHLPQPKTDLTGLED